MNEQEQILRLTDATNQVIQKLHEQIAAQNVMIYFLIAWNLILTGIVVAIWLRRQKVPDAVPLAIKK